MKTMTGVEKGAGMGYYKSIFTQAQCNGAISAGSVDDLTTRDIRTLDHMTQHWMAFCFQPLSNRLGDVT